MPNEKASKLVLCPDETYRWTYRLNMYRNPVIFLTVIKVLLISILTVAAFGCLVGIIDGSLFENIKNADWTPLLISIAVFLAITVLSYLIVAKQYGGEYYVLFEMDKEKITHKQMDSQFDKAKAIGWLTAMTGIIAGNPAAVGLGINTATKNEMTSYYTKTKRIVPIRMFNVIKVNGLLQHNQIYVHPDDFDFVLNYLRTAKQASHKK